MSNDEHKFDAKMETGHVIQAGEIREQHNYFGIPPSVLIITALIVSAIILVIIFYRVSTSQNSFPRFVVDKAVLKPDEPIIIRSDNAKANRNESLDIEFDGIGYPRKGIPAGTVAIENADCQIWRFNLKEQSITPKMTEDGDHKLRSSFAGENPQNEIKIIFCTKPPIVRGDISQPDDKPETRQISGKILRDTEIPNNCYRRLKTDPPSAEN